MNKVQWRRTPYAMSSSQNADLALTKLLGKYGMDTFQITQHPGPDNRLAVSLRFVFKGKSYKIAAQILDVEGVSQQQLLTQAKRWIYWYLKSVLELIGYFAPAEQLLLPFLETSDKQTVYDVVSVTLDHIPKAAGLLQFMQKQLPALPGPDDA